MPQVFQVLRCYKCSIFQIHQTKKLNKFECKMCGEKQSVKRHYGIGTAKDCRLHVQKLNVLRGNAETKPFTESSSDDEFEDRSNKFKENIDRINPAKLSKWSVFVEKEKDSEAIEEPILGGDTHVLKIPRQKKPRKFNVKVKTNDSEEYLCSTNDTSNVVLQSDLKLNIKNDSDSFESDEILPTLGSALKNENKQQLTCVDNLMTERPLDNPIVSQTVNSNSKWAQYVDTEGDENLDGVALQNDNSKKCVSNSDNLFSLCDDSDLDLVLDI